ncbi:fam-l protein [Plasmodium malariae]|uniref:Fam-l protein n=1 Tax=Plasmodium malariae TaxID=5858 RepID=A0A1D3JI25_PLAMA|nr:fam-l protein [Plasmodium malariae]SBT86132.1 fam-l protein [Plasmodium malariae]
MEEKTKSLLYIGIVTFFILCRICHINDDIGTLNKYFNENYMHDSKLNIRNYRSLEKYKQDKVSNNVWLKEEVPNNGTCEKKYVSINERVSPGKKKQSNGFSSNNLGGNKQDMKNKSCIFETKQYSRLEKKIFKEIDYVDFLKNNRTISNKVYFKTIYKKYVPRFALPLFFLLLFFTYLLADFWGCGLIGILCYVLNKITPDWLEPLHELLKKSALAPFFKSIGKLPRDPSTGRKVPDHFYVTGFLGLFIYLIPFIIFGVTLILKVVYYHKKVKKYQKIKFGKR